MELPSFEADGTRLNMALEIEHIRCAIQLAEAEGFVHTKQALEYLLQRLVETQPAVTLVEGA